MSHVNDQEHDFDGLEQLSPEDAEQVIEARTEARSIIDKLEPCHITSRVHLIAILEEALNTVRQNEVYCRLVK